MEKRAVNDMFVIISDIWLDNEEVIYILVQLFIHVFFVWFSFSFGCVFRAFRNLNVVLCVEKTMRKLETVLDGYENVEVVPSLFVFMGNFCTHPCNLSFSSFSSLR